MPSSNRSEVTSTHPYIESKRENFKNIPMANTKAITDTAERKTIKRAARKKAAPKAKRTTPRGANKQKAKKLAKAASKR